MDFAFYGSGPVGCAQHVAGGRREEGGSRSVVAPISLSLADEFLVCLFLSLLVLIARVPLLQHLLISQFVFFPLRMAR